MSPEPNTHETIEFLIRYRGDEPIVLTAIVPDGGPVESETFRPQSDGARLEAWLNERQGKKNLYFTVNPTLKPLSGRVKAKKEHIRGMIALHVDLDPRAGEDLEKERTRALALIKGFKPAPSFIIDSGGGFQGFWVLPKEMPTNGSTSEAAPLEAYNQQIALLLAADPCHNIDRIMRLPGTLNIPDKKKLAKGRKLACARLVEWNGTKHDLTEFTPAPAVQFKSERSGEGVKLSGNLAKTDLDKLPKQVSSKLKTIIVQGEDAEDVNRFPSRSEALFYVCCELIRGGVDDDTIASIIMDRDLGIAASVLDKPRPAEYAARQIQRAREEVECPELRELNDQFAVIHNYGGRCRVISEACDFAMGGQRRIAAHSFDDFRNMFCNRFVQIGKKTEALGTWWLKHPKRRQYRTVSFCPERPVPPDVYNLWGASLARRSQATAACFFNMYVRIFAPEIQNGTNMF
jgi:hypothetical protein